MISRKFSFHAREFPREGRDHMAPVRNGFAVGSGREGGFPESGAAGELLKNFLLDGCQGGFFCGLFGGLHELLLT
jgi:hypothetical protein